MRYSRFSTTALLGTLATGGDLTADAQGDLTAIIALARVYGERLELTGPPVWAVNNVIRRHDRLPIRLVSWNIRPWRW